MKGVCLTQGFQKGQKAFHMDCLLVHLDLTKEIILACDASFYRVEAVLSHGSSMVMKGFVMHSLEAKKNYLHLEKDGAYHSVWSKIIFHQYCLFEIF